MQPQPVQPEWIGKNEAAERLNLSTRAVLDAASKGKIRSEKQRDTKTRQMAVMLNAADVERYAYERDHPEESAPISVVPARRLPGGSNSQSAEELYQAMYMAELLQRHRVQVPWLNLSEAADYSGLPKSTIEKLIHAQQLKAIDCGPRPGGKYRIKRSDLDALEGMNQ